MHGLLGSCYLVNVILIVNEVLILGGTPPSCQLEVITLHHHHILIAAVHVIAAPK